MKSNIATALLDKEVTEQTVSEVAELVSLLVSSDPDTITVDVSARIAQVIYNAISVFSKYTRPSAN